ncbi:MAG TPA: S9 family peptidase [Chitinophagaceae bacterium]
MKQNSLLVAFVITSAMLFAQTKTNWSPDQCLKMKNISAVAPSPDGSKVVYTVREAIMTDDRSEYVNQVYLCNSDGSNTTQLTKGDKNSANPKWSPDGKWIAFTSSRDGKTNLYILPVGGGEAEKVTDVKSGVGNYEWSHDGTMIAFLMADVADKEEKNKKSKNDWYFMDEEVKQNRLYGLWLNKKDSAGKRVQKLLTRENYNINAFDWSPDGKSIAFSHGKTPEVNDNVYSDISLIEIESGKTKSIAATGAGESNPSFSPDGKMIAYYCSTDPVDWSGPRHAKIYSVADGNSWRLKATPDENGAIAGWTADGKNILWTEANKTLNSVYVLSVDGKSVTEWNKGATDLLGAASINSTGTHVAFILQNPSKLPEAYISSINNYSPVKVTNLNAENANKPLPKTEVIQWKGADGKEIEGLLTYPLNYKAGTKVPFILNVHGGPAGVFQQTCVAGNGGAYPIAAFAEMGYAVLRPNPRGSSGYGAEFRMANRADWGGKDFIDLMAGVDEVIKMGVADESKMGVMGWSYGGFMSSWIVGHTDRFKVASIGAPVVDLSHQNLTDDIEGFLPSYFKTDPWNDWSLFDAHSPLRFVQNVKTPVMLQHCEGDQRVPISNAIMFYNALRRRGVPVRMLAMPRQGHGPVEPTMVLKTMQTNVEWFEKHIGDKKSF